MGIDLGYTERRLSVACPACNELFTVGNEFIDHNDKSVTVQTHQEVECFWCRKPLQIVVKVTARMDIVKDLIREAHVTR